MEPRREEQQKALQPSAKRKPKRFRLIKLEERIAPRGGRITRLGYTCGGCDTSMVFCGETTLCGGTTHPPGHCK